MTNHHNKVLIGIDLGGTYVRTAAVTEYGDFLATRNLPLQPERGPEPGLQLITNLIKETLQEAGEPKLAGIGVGATGPVDPLRGLIQNPYTLPTWDNVPIVSTLEDYFRVPVVLENDADAAALGEYWLGAGQQIERLCAVTVGTGIGTAFLQHGQVFRGSGGAHPEIGHQLIDPTGPLCYCGVHGCWESLASGTAIAQFARLAVPDTGSMLLEMAGGDAQSITAALVAEAARRKDLLSCEIIEQAAGHFARGLLNVITFFIPDMIVLSGGVMRSLDLFMPAIENAVRDYSLMVPANQVKIIPARMGYQAGMAGAAYAILCRLNAD